MMYLFLFFASLIVPALSTEGDFPGLDWLTPPLTYNSDVIYQFPVGTWLESLALRRHNKILTTALSSPELFEVDMTARNRLSWSTLSKKTPAVPASSN